MEAPKKIYICPSELAGIDYEEEWLDRPFGDSIEYIRTDAFIDKACEWLKFNYVEFTDNSRLGLNINELIKDFKKAMEEQ